MLERGRGLGEPAAHSHTQLMSCCICRSFMLAPAMASSERCREVNQEPGYCLKSCTVVEDECSPWLASCQ